jgi:hypothetical protein
MKLKFLKTWTKGTLLLGGLLCIPLTGCQTNIAGQTLPSAYFLRDDVQFYPAGPETKLINQIQALEEYKIQQQKNIDDFGELP